MSYVVLAANRSSFFHFRDLVHALRPRQGAERRVFLVGTSELTEAALHYLALHNIRCVGLIDNNGGGDLGRRVWGTEVIGRIDDLGRLADRHRVGEVIVPENEPLPICEVDFQDVCSRANIRLVKLGLYAAMPVSEPPRRSDSDFLDGNTDVRPGSRGCNLDS